MMWLGFARRSRFYRALLFLALGCLPLPAQSPSDALALQTRGDWAGAETIWRKLIVESPNDFRYWTSLGVVLAHRDRFPEAIDAYRKAKALSPNDPQTNLNLGLAYFKTGRLPQAIAPLEIAAPALPQAELLLGMSLYGAGKPAQAIPHLETARLSTSNDGKNNNELDLVLARAYLKSNDFAKARDQFARMLTANPDSAQVHLLLGEAYDGLGKAQSALDEFQIAARGPGIPGAHFGVGYLRLRDKNYASAIAEFRRELALNPQDHAALAYLGDALFKSGDLLAARQFLRQSIAIKDNLWITHYDLGVLAEKDHNYDAAHRELNLAAQVNPKRAEIHYHLAQVYKATGDPTRAQQQLRIVTSIHASQTDDLISKVSTSADR